MIRQHPSDQARTGAYVVQRPRAADGIGRALGAIYRSESLTAEMQRLLDRLDRTTISDRG